MQQVNRIILAPMEGVLDGAVRELLTQVNQYDYCVTEFVRVTDQLLPKKTYYRLCPELQHQDSFQGKTLSGTPIRVQLLGQSPEHLAANAVRAIELGSFGIDLNAGCPAKTVVGSQGGAYLLKTPELIYQITRAVRQAVAKEFPVSVKVRLGWDDKSLCYEIADAVEQGGATEITIHGRTKEDGYRADRIDWQTIGKIQQTLSIPVIANGEIFSVQAAQQCMQETHCQDIMIGRGALNLPNIANIIRLNEERLAWDKVLTILYRYAQTTQEHLENKPFYHSSRIKQWLTYLKVEYPQAVTLLQEIRTLKAQQEMIDALAKRVEL
ncbi:tRNA dihydrouridine(16) synthase DusC [Zophobihabitans entericus]|uniref:tRNA-dihydrouridine(16) synthase n=1 Tax=Zophobihabitans entericus TaxID=1635327 RepID=A0A6G9IBZ3_9GAMM|nr:tRNA dihydrouridine(16) synthase DusC [Zophobihabitans entericus]QIQ21234.1 tRNA dihydrouridine(16) synthase DusC [Zophobihabitans entericus]